MLAELISKLEGIIKERDDLKVVALQNDPRTVLVRNGGAVTERKVPAPLRSGAVRSLTDFVAVHGDTAICMAPEVWVGDETVLLVLDRNDRREKITLPITKTPRCLHVQSAAAMGNPLCSGTPKAVIRWLRFNMPGEQTDRLIKALGAIDFTRSGVDKSRTEFGKESLGMAVEMSVQQAQDVPQEVEVSFPAFVTDGFDDIYATFQIGTHLDLENKVVELRPFPDQVQKESERIQNAVFSNVNDALPTGAACFRGSHV